MEMRSEFGVGAIFSLIGDSLNKVEDNLSKMDFCDLENHSVEVVQEFGRRYLQLMTNLRVKAEPTSRKKVKCEQCKKNINIHKSQAPRGISTLYGDIDLCSDYYYCRGCGQGVRPFDQKLHLKSNANESPALEEMVCLFGKDYSFEKASQMLKRTLNIEISDNRVLSITEAKGSEVLEYQKKRADEYKAYPDLQKKQSLRNSKVGTLYLEVDGSYVPLQKKYKEAKLVVSFEQKDRYESSKDRPLLLNKNYTGKIAYIDDFKKYFEYHARTHGADEADRLVVLGDGAEWIWNLAKEYLRSDRIEILDYYHASEYIWDFSKQILTDEKAIEEFAKSLEGTLLEDSVENTISKIKELKLEDEEHLAARKTILGYFEKNRSRMNYKEYREKGLIIGSGAIEGGNKNVIHQRCRQAGMHWTEDGANSLIALRCLYESNMWDDLKWGNQNLAMAS